MAKNRVKTNLLHFKDGNQYEVMREKSSGKLFIKNTEIEVTGKVIRNNQQKTKAYDFNKRLSLEVRANSGMKSLKLLALIVVI